MGPSAAALELCIAMIAQTFCLTGRWKKSVQVIRDQAGGVAKTTKGGWSCYSSLKSDTLSKRIMGLFAKCDSAKRRSIWAGHSGEILALER